MKKINYSNLVLVVIGGYIILNSGFMLLKIPPIGPGLPIGESVVLLSLFLLVVDNRFIIQFLNNTAFIPLAIFCSIGFCHLVFDGPKLGFWAFRDAAHLFEIAFLWIGFRVAITNGAFSKIYIWSKFVFKVSVLYMLAYPFRETLTALSPKISSYGAYSNPLFFSYTNSSSSLIAGITLNLIDEKSKHRFIHIFLSLIALVILVTLVQVRVAYLQIMLIPLMIILFAPQHLKSLFNGLILGIIGILAFAALDLEIPSRLGNRFSVEFLLNHLQAMWGGGNETVKDAADGVALRLVWWNEIFKNTTSNPLSFLFGNGFGYPLTSFEGPEGDITREPHNSFVSVFARYGVLGLCCFVALHVHIFYCAIILLYKTKRNGFYNAFNFLIVTIVFLGCNIFFSIVEGGFEASYVAIPYYFMSGVIYALKYLIDNEKFVVIEDKL